jgi:predicted Holliday junction resolvase-like endonuclease
MAIAETAAVASIIGKLLSMSTDLIERHKSSDILTEIREIQKLTIELHTLYTKIEAKHHEIESDLQNNLFKSQSQITQLEKDNFNVIREKDEILKRLNEWDKYERKVSRMKFVYMSHKTEPHVYACAVCQGKEPYPVILQPSGFERNRLRSYHCSKCNTEGYIDF